jgi:hypothetical protein
MQIEILEGEELEQKKAEFIDLARRFHEAWDVEPIRKHFGKPIFLSSGYRSKALNSAVPGSSSTSQHCSGEALDLDQDDRNTGITNKMVFDYIKNNLGMTFVKAKNTSPRTMKKINWEVECKVLEATCDAQ